MRTLLIAIGLAALGVCLGAESQRVFRSAVDLVTITVVVVDSDGQPVRGLGPDDFTVSLDGQRRPVRALDYRETLSAAALAGGASPSSFGSTGGSPAGRTIMLLFDDLSFPMLSTDLPALRLAAEATLRQLAPSDRVGVATTSGRGAQIKPTGDHGSAASAIRRIAGWLPPHGTVGVYVSLAEAADIVRGGPRRQVLEEVNDRECRLQNIDDKDVCESVLDGQARIVLAETRDRTARQIDAYGRVLASLAGEPGPRVLILMSEGLATGSSVGFTSDLSQVARAAAVANVQLYAVLGERNTTTVTESLVKRAQVRSAEVALLQDGLRSVAGAVGGAVFRFVGRPERSLERILLESSGVYELGIDAPPGDRDRFSDVVVSVIRPGVTVRANRRAVLSPVALPPVAADEESRVLAEGRVALGVPLSVAASSRREPAGTNLQLAVDLAVPATVAAPIRVAFAIIDASGRAVKSGTGTIADDPAAGEYRFAFALPLPAGEYTVRVAVTDADRRVGGVEHPVSLQLRPIGRFLASDLQTGWIDSDGVKRFLGLARLPAAAVAADIGLELYADAAAPDGAVEIRVDMAAVGGSAPLASAVFEPPAVGGRRQLHLTVPVDALPPGLYSVKATVLEDGTAVGSLSTTLEKVLEPSGALSGSRLPSREDVLGALVGELRAQGDPFDSMPLLAPSIVRAGLRSLAASAGGTLSRGFDDEAMTEADLWDAVSVIAREPRNALGAFSRGLLNLRLANAEAARAQFELALERAPASVTALLYLGAAHGALGRDEDAVGAWQLALGDPETSPEWLLAHADALGRLGEWREAAVVLRSLRASQPGSLDVLRRSIRVDVLEGRVTEAQTALERLIEGRPDDDDARWWQLVLAFTDAVGPGALPSATEVFKDLARRYLERDGPQADVVRAWLAAVS